ncbi:MAG TPA: hypothetical protein VJ774_01725 [Actinomycetota bacterium]|nr:hypothetical protein [Actinomycetota bacterium]
MKRASRIALSVIALLAMSPGVASAKIPPFSVEVSPDPTAGETIRLTVRFWDDAKHTDRATWWDIRALNDFLWARPVGDASDAIPIDIRLVRQGVYRAEFAVSSPGRWILCTWKPRCAGGPAMVGYPNRIGLAVASSAPDPVARVMAEAPAEPSPSRLPMPLLGLSVLAAAAAVVVVHTTRPRRA